VWTLCRWLRDRNRRAGVWRAPDAYALALDSCRRDRDGRHWASVGREGHPPKRPRLKIGMAVQHSFRSEWVRAVPPLRQKKSQGWGTELWCTAIMEPL